MSNLLEIFEEEKKRTTTTKKYHPASFLTVPHIEHAKIFAQYNYVYLFIGNTFHEVQEKRARKKKRTWDKKKSFVNIRKEWTPDLLNERAKIIINSAKEQTRKI